MFWRQPVRPAGPEEVTIGPDEGRRIFPRMPCCGCRHLDPGNGHRGATEFRRADVVPTRGEAAGPQPRRQRITGTAALGPALPVDNPHIGGAKRIRESHVDTDEISDNHGGIPAIFECDESYYVQGGELAVWLAQIVDVREDNNNPGCSIYRAIWYEDPVLAANGDTGTAEVYSRDGPGTYIGLPQCRLITADSSLNHGTNQKNGKWKKGGASCGMRLPKSAMAFWKTVVEETIARKDADRAAEPSDIDSEPVSRAKAAKRRRKATAA